jgi:hypothetical protein
MSPFNRSASNPANCRRCSAITASVASSTTRRSRSVIRVVTKRRSPASRARAIMPAAFHPIQQPCSIRHWGDHAVHDLAPAEALLSGSSQDSQHVELRRSHLVRLERVRHGVFEQSPGAAQAEMRLLLQAGEGAPMLDLVTKVGAHERKCICFHIECQDTRSRRVFLPFVGTRRRREVSPADARGCDRGRLRGGVRRTLPGSGCGGLRCELPLDPAHVGEADHPADACRIHPVFGRSTTATRSTAATAPTIDVERSNARAEGSSCRGGTSALYMGSALRDRSW